ncbi:hypothetical protein DFJ77DRAFT_448409 [Powellomyces hirtus]|nr:hypothetical protein DFJ77DRAFT_448409 [Powellomyces hirtus]
MAPFRALALLFLVSSASASNLYQRQAANATAAPAPTETRIVVPSTAAPPVVTPPVVIPIITTPVVPATTPILPVVTSVVPATTAPVVPATTPVAVTATPVAPVSQPAGTTSRPRPAATTGPVTSTQPASETKTPLAGGQISGVDPTSEPYTGVSKTLVIVLAAAGSAIVLAAIGIFLFRRFGVPSSEKFKKRMSDAGGSTAFLHRRSPSSQMELGDVSGNMIEHPTFGPRRTSSEASAAPSSESLAPMTMLPSNSIEEDFLGSMARRSVKPLRCAPTVSSVSSDPAQAPDAFYDQYTSAYYEQQYDVTSQYAQPQSSQGYPRPYHQQYSVYTPHQPQHLGYEYGVHQEGQHYDGPHYGHQ